VARSTKRPTPRRRAPATLDGLAGQVAALSRRLDELAGPGPSAATRPPALAAGGDDLGLADALAARRGAPYEAGTRRGAVAYGGGVSIDGREYLWQVERPVPGLLALDPTGPAEVLATLAHPHRLRLLLALIEAPRTAAELQAIIGSSSPGPLYHHLRDLLALGIVVQRERAYLVATRHVVPLLAAIAIAIDLGARRANPE
jgi:DNA-binding transcriptional ArsR family regulator